jgi:hypothetical protein
MEMIMQNYGTISQPLKMYGWLFCALTVLPGCWWGHPFPRNELYEARAAGGDSAVVRIQTYYWSDGKYRFLPGVLFREKDGTVWRVYINAKEPSAWTVYRCSGDGKLTEVPLDRIYVGYTHPTIKGKSPWPSVDTLRTPEKASPAIDKK